MDNLLMALKTGQAFNVNREKRDGKKRTPRAAGGKDFVHCAVIPNIQMLFGNTLL